MSQHCKQKLRLFSSQGGPFESTWQTKYAKLYPNRLELHTENNKPQLIFMEDIEDINTELVTVSGGNRALYFTLKKSKISHLSTLLDKLPLASGHINISSDKQSKQTLKLGYNSSQTPTTHILSCCRFVTSRVSS